MRNLLLLAAAAAIPLPEHEADAFVSATFEGVAVAVPRFAIWARRSPTPRFWRL